MEAVGSSASRPYCASPDSWVETKRWEGGGGGGGAGDLHLHHPGYSADGWKEARPWMDNGRPSAANNGVSPIRRSPSSASICSTGPNSGSVDTVLYQNLVEMMPLVESFMDQRGSIGRSFPRHASLVYTPTPARDWPLKKAAESPSKNRMGRSLSRGKLLFWEDDENSNGGSREAYPDPEEIPMLSLSTEHQGGENFISKDELIQLQSHVEKLEQKLKEKDKQLQSNLVNTGEVSRVQADLDHLQTELSRKDREIHELRTSVSNKENEIASVRAQLEESRLNALKSGWKASEVEKEMIGLRCQVTALLYQLELIDACNMDEIQGNTADVVPTLAMGEMKERRLTNSEEKEVGMEQAEDNNMEKARCMYMAALIAAREKPEEELLTLVAQLRSQMQSFMIQPTLSTLTDDVV